MTDKMRDQRYLRDDQYKNSTNLKARSSLHTRYTTEAQTWPDWLFEQIDAPADAAVLEVGSGFGMLWEANAERIPPGWRVVLSDFSPGMVGDLRDNLADAHHPLAFAALDAQAIPMADASVDIVIANHMLYHIPDLPRALAEIRRVLRPTGTLYASTNGARHMHQLYELVRAFGGEPSDEHQVIRTFNLENGAVVLSPYFAHVDVRPRKNQLNVTDVEPLVEYVRSNWDMDKRTIDANVDGFRAFVGQSMRDGSFWIDTDSGMLVASGMP